MHLVAGFIALISHVAQWRLTSFLVMVLELPLLNRRPRPLRRAAAGERSLSASRRTEVRRRGPGAGKLAVMHSLTAVDAFIPFPGGRER